MAKYYGKIGYMITEETAPSVWTEEVTERYYYGDVIRNNSRYDSSSNLNDNLNVNVQISIVADPFAYQNFYSIRYIEWMNALWKVTSVEPQFPRLLLSIGGVYNGEQA